MSHSSALEAIIHGYKDTKITNYLGVSGHALVVVDFLETFPDEVRLMWPTPLSLPKVLFFALRYYILVHSVFAATYGVPTGMSPKQCSDSFLRVALSSIITMIASEGRRLIMSQLLILKKLTWTRLAILFIRVYAFSGRNKKLLVFLVVQYLAIHASAFALLYKFIKTVHFVKFPIDHLVCFPAQSKNILLSGVFALLLGSVIIVMFIMMYIAFRKHRNINNALITIFYRDGIFYFICLSALATANIIVNLAAPSSGMKFLLVQSEVNIHVILSTRMLLHLRSWAEKDHWAGRGSVTGTMAAFEYSTRLGGRDLRNISAIQFEKRVTHAVDDTTDYTMGTAATDTRLGSVSTAYAI
ncbi:hypothetical protein D9611_012060 [Ephemerocybe angulata]|uniref:DUF6533 domain-containing protein n=1 Tax=Ephemerocybe angulata TaxID=980116 RepID=A0A8H5ASU7_9AGAR|nr:hypothetical protein D9611_012060 [Tulosesus angulatus]